MPGLGARPASFGTLVHLILEQQVSLASAQAVFDRLRQRLGPGLRPQDFLQLDREELQGLGFSRQKVTYGQALAQALAGGDLDLDELDRASDDEVRRQLTALPGIGPWTADVYLLMVLRRPDVWPAGDLALARGLQHHHRLATRPAPDETTRLAAPWRPWRSVAARLIWSDYLDRQATR
ncbi:MAG: DNA-3-methyladenine glycosylase 2 family protein [Acidobacteriota bacterium]